MAASAEFVSKPDQTVDTLTRVEAPALGDLRKQLARVLEQQEQLLLANRR